MHVTPNTNVTICSNNYLKALNYVTYHTTTNS